MHPAFDPHRLKGATVTLPSEQLYIEFEYQTKICNSSTCVHNGTPQLLKNFSKDRKSDDGLNPRCKDCSHNAYLRDKAGLIERCKAAAASIDETVLKVCIKCATPKSFDEFHKSNRTKDGRKAICKECRSRKKPIVQTPIPESKTCSDPKCTLAGILQPIDNFYQIPSKPFKSGIDSKCKSCRSAYGKSLYAKLKLRDLPPEENRVCSRCEGDPQPIDNFAKHVSGRGGRSAMCKTCEKKREQEWRAKNLEEQLTKQKSYYQRDKEKQLKWSKNRRFERFGVNQEWYDNKFASQGRKCEICGSTDPKGPATRFAIDHNHSCCGEKMACAKCRRGLLCFPCNSRLSRIESEWIRSALIYLLKYDTDLSHIFEALSARQ